MEAGLPAHAARFVAHALGRFACPRHRTAFGYRAAPAALSAAEGQLVTVTAIPPVSEGDTVSQIAITPARSLGLIDPKLFGGFVEHLGRCIYGGLYDQGSSLSEERTGTLAEALAWVEYVNSARNLATSTVSPSKVSLSTVSDGGPVLAVTLPPRSFTVIEAPLTDHRLA